ncbi:hypothetical protein Btru_030367 [Bulinus truncatus]|nr:hypothetical protein Btru_030367 [Bulinus truncatus]
MTGKYGRQVWQASVTVKCDRKPATTACYQARPDKDRQSLRDKDSQKKNKKSEPRRKKERCLQRNDISSPTAIGYVIDSGINSRGQVGWTLEGNTSMDRSAKKNEKKSVCAQGKTSVHKHGS